MKTNRITNPVLRGSPPRPPSSMWAVTTISPLRPLNDFQAYRSAIHLIHWETLGGALNDPSSLDLRGVGPSLPAR